MLWFSSVSLKNYSDILRHYGFFLVQTQHWKSFYSMYATGQSKCFPDLEHAVRLKEGIIKYATSLNRKSINICFNLQNDVMILTRL